MKIVVIGGTGLIGSQVVQGLRALGHEAVPAHADTGVNTITGEGLEATLGGAQVVVADLATDGATVVRVPSVDLQPFAARDVAEAMITVALSEPANGFVEIAGPEKIKFHEAVRRVLEAHDDPRKVVGEANARYFGTQLTDTSMTAGPGARLGRTSLAEWLAGSQG